MARVKPWRDRIGPLQGFRVDCIYGMRLTLDEGFGGGIQWVWLV
ncbi:MAG: hypothetical protein R3C20_16435 [Planctomycetaceae bacterium]